MTRKISKLSSLAQSKSDLLIFGEPGVGKRHLVRDIFATRGTNTLLKIEGSSATDPEIREILDRVKGNTTLCIANIDSLVPHNQAAVISLLNGRKRYKSLRVIATAVSLNLLELDLEEKLKSFQQLDIPPLRERLKELPEIVNLIVLDLCKTLGKKPLKVEDATIAVLSRSTWPGNLRELHAVIGAGVMRSHGEKFELAAEYLNEYQHLESVIKNIAVEGNFALDEALDIIEKLLIQRALKQYQYNQSQTAEILGLSEANFRYRLKKFRLPSVRNVR